MANKMTNEELSHMCQKAGGLGFVPDRLRLLDQRLTEWSQSGKTPSIAVKILRCGQTAFEAAYGLQGPGREPDSLRVDGIFPVASITKPVVAALLLILQEQGRVDLNHPVREYLPEFTGDEQGQIRVWHLLSHASGIDDRELSVKTRDYIRDVLGVPLPDWKAPQGKKDQAILAIREKLGLPTREPDLKTHLETFRAANLRVAPSHPPETVFSYSSFGYQLAADLLLRVTGGTLDSVAQKMLFDPLGMKDSCFLLPDDNTGRFVTRAEDCAGGSYMNKEILKEESGSGGLKTTVGDITRFGQMFLNLGTLDGVRVLSPASVREMTADHNSRVPNSDEARGLGWNLRGTKHDDVGLLRSARTFDHAGTGCSRVLCDPEADLVAAFFTVSKKNDYIYHGSFFNMVLASVE